MLYLKQIGAVMLVDRVSKNLIRSDTGVWFGNRSNPVSYPDIGHAESSRFEDKSFWYQHRNACILASLKLIEPRGAIFDVGGGNGVVSLALQDAGYDVVLIEPRIEGAFNSLAKGIREVICSRTDEGNFVNGSFPAIGLFDVLEHVEDASAFLTHLHELLDDEGCVYTTVPAYSLLWSEADNHAGHFRRYTSSNLKAAFESCGFEIRFVSYFFKYLVAPIFLLRSLPYLVGMRINQDEALAKREHVANESMMNKMLRYIHSNEPDRIASANSIDFGASCILVAQKKRAV